MTKFDLTDLPIGHAVLLEVLLYTATYDLMVIRLNADLCLGKTGGKHSQVSWSVAKLGAFGESGILTCESYTVIPHIGNLLVNFIDAYKKNETPF